jgi:hypothetical protein
MTRPAVALIAGACGVITIVITVNHFRTGDGVNVEARTRAASIAAQSIEQRGGWSAKPGPPTALDFRSGGGAPAGLSSGNAPAGVGSGGAPVGGASGGSAGGGFADARTGGPTVLTGERRSGGVVGFSGSHVPAAGGGTSVRLSAPEAAVKFEGAGMAGGARDEQVVLANVPHGQIGADPGKQGQDPNEPVLSLPLDRTIQPEKGDAPVAAQGITFDSGAGAKFAADAQFVVPNAGGLTGEAGTISFNLQNDWTGSDNTDASLMKIRDPNQWADRVEITKNGQYLRMGLWDNAGNESGVSVPINWQPGEQHQITAAWGDGVVTLAVDGRSVGQSTYPDKLIFSPTAPMYIGSDVPGGQGGARSTLSDIKVYPTKLN